MAKPRHFGNEEMLMVPFLDILCSLIGVLVLIIVFLAVSQTTQTEGRTEEEVNRAIKHRQLSQRQQREAALESEVKPLLVKLASLEQEAEAKEQQAARLRKLVSQAEESKVLSQNLLKSLDNLLLEITGYETQTAEVKKSIAELAAEIKKRNLVAKTPGPVMVQPAGAGMEPDSKVFFVEASGGKIVLYWSKTELTQVSSAAEVIIADTSYETFLKKVKEQPKSKIVFLVRDDGLGSYNNAAGWAQQTHAFEPAQVAKLPIPGRGRIDLAMFDSILGTIPVPEGVPLLPPATPIP
ncbi:MAG: hypothetical protein ABL994_11720 [Verrucomicrobiales bacterium]